MKPWTSKGKSSDRAAENSDEDWRPSSKPILTNCLQNEGEAADEDQLSHFKNKHLCEECGALYIYIYIFMMKVINLAANTAMFNQN